MNLLMRFLDYLGRVLLPVRLRPTVLQYRVQTALDKAALEAEKGVGKAGTHAERIEAGEHPKVGWFGFFFRWFLHFFFVGLVLAGLWWLNRWLQLERVLRSDWPILHAFWLPLLFLLLYLMAWLAWWIWELTGPEKLTNEFPDIDHAWKEGLRNVGDAGVSINDVPLFLVLGRPVEGEDNVLLAAQMGFKVREVPRWPEAPLRFSASDHAVFLTCAGASVLGKHITLLVEEIQEALGREALLPETGDVSAPSAAPVVVIDEEAEAKPIVEVVPVVAAKVETATPQVSTDEEQRIVGLMVAEERAAQPTVPSRRRTFLKNRGQVQEVMARLQHLCQLIVRHRRPYCPINGILVLLPLAATDGDEDAAQATTACQLDLTVVRETMQVQCPVFVLGCDSEQRPGFREFLMRMPASQRDRRMGQRFPLIADVEPGGVADMIQQGVGWFSHTFLPALVYNLFRLENPHNGVVESGMPDAVAGNVRLYQFLGDLRQRRQRLARFVTRGLMLDTPDPMFFGGLYLAGTGPDAERDRGFVSGVFQRLPENQNFVSWTSEALEQEKDFKRWTRYGYFLFVVLLGAIGVLIYRLWFR
jgi:hypothetical protein